MARDFLKRKVELQRKSRWCKFGVHISSDLHLHIQTDSRLKINKNGNAELCLTSVNTFGYFHGNPNSTSFLSRVNNLLSSYVGALWARHAFTHSSSTNVCFNENSLPFTGANQSDVVCHFSENRTMSPISFRAS